MTKVRSGVFDVSFDGGQMWLGRGPSGQEDAKIWESDNPAASSQASLSSAIDNALTVSIAADFTSS